MYLSRRASCPNPTNGIKGLRMCKADCLAALGDFKPTWFTNVSQSVQLLDVLGPGGSRPDPKVVAAFVEGEGDSPMGSVAFQSLLKTVGRENNVSMPFKY